MGRDYDHAEQHDQREMPVSQHAGARARHAPGVNDRRHSPGGMRRDGADEDERETGCEERQREGDRVSRDQCANGNEQQQGWKREEQAAHPLVDVGIAQTRPEEGQEGGRCR
jgi:hypothetical protein